MTLTLASVSPLHTSTQPAGTLRAFLTCASYAIAVRFIQLIVIKKIFSLSKMKIKIEVIQVSTQSSFPQRYLKSMGLYFFSSLYNCLRYQNYKRAFFSYTKGKKLWLCMWEGSLVSCVKSLTVSNCKSVSDVGCHDCDRHNQALLS